MTRQNWRTLLISLLLLASATEFVVRGPLRLLHGGTGWNDFLSPYIQARAWVHGQDPYSPQSLLSFWPSGNQRPVWVDAEAANGTLERKRGIPSPYPLPSLVVLSPLSELPWPVAICLWSLLNTVAYVLSALAFLHICGVGVQLMRSQLFLIAVLALAPVHTGLATANPAILAVALMVGAHWAAQKEKAGTAGAILAIAICLKPTIAGGLLLFYMVRRRWKIAAIACSVAAAITLLGATRLLLTGVPWLSSYLENTRRIFSVGSVDDFTRADRLRYDMINSQIVISGLIRNAQASNLVSRCLGVAMFAWWLRECLRPRNASDILQIGAICCLSLIAVYHRFYDAALLIWPLAWCLLVVRSRTVTLLTMAVIAPFFVHGQVLLSNLAAAGKVPHVVTSSWWWNNVALPHEAWFLIFLTLLLLAFMARDGFAKTNSQSVEGVAPIQTSA